MRPEDKAELDVTVNDQQTRVRDAVIVVMTLAFRDSGDNMASYTHSKV